MFIQSHSRSDCFHNHHQLYFKLPLITYSSSWNPLASVEKYFRGTLKKQTNKTNTVLIDKNVKAEANLTPSTQSHCTLKYSERLSHSLHKSNRGFCMEKYSDNHFSCICLSNELICGLKVTTVTIRLYQLEDAASRATSSGWTFVPSASVITSLQLQQIWFVRRAAKNKYSPLLSCFQPQQDSRCC